MQTQRSAQSTTGQIPRILLKYTSDKDVRWSLYLTNRITQDTFWSKDIYEQAFFVDTCTVDPSKMRIRHTGVGTKGDPNPLVVSTVKCHCAACRRAAISLAHALCTFAKLGCQDLQRCMF